MKNGFYFLYKALFALEILNILSFFSFSFHSFQIQRVRPKKRIFVSIFCNSKRLVTGSRPLTFHNFVDKKELSAKEKIKLTFSWSLLKQLIFKSLIHALVGLGYLPNLKRDIGLVFTADFLHTSSIKIPF